eukprot:Opistho-2@38552
MPMHWPGTPRTLLPKFCLQNPMQISSHLFGSMGSSPPRFFCLWPCPWVSSLPRGGGGIIPCTCALAPSCAGDSHPQPAGGGGVSRALAPSLLICDARMRCPQLSYFHNPGV